jgi:hypothetical protein
MDARCKPAEVGLIVARTSQLAIGNISAGQSWIIKTSAELALMSVTFKDLLEDGLLIRTNCSAESSPGVMVPKSRLHGQTRTVDTSTLLCTTSPRNAAMSLMFDSDSSALR